MEASRGVTVFKIGGSLLDVPDLAERLQCVLAQRPDARPLLVVGGGTAADLVRRWDAIHRLGDETAHWLAIRAMALNERLVEALLPASVVVDSRDAAKAAWSTGRIPILSCFAFVQSEESAVSEEQRLPRNWSVTSDSIAAWIAQRWPADELVLVKSCEMPVENGSDVVDRAFTASAAGLRRVGWMNLRDVSPAILAWPGCVDFSEFPATPARSTTDH